MVKERKGESMAENKTAGMKWIKKYIQVQKNNTTIPLQSSVIGAAV
jgi:hypothetical protein